MGGGSGGGLHGGRTGEMFTWTRSLDAWIGFVAGCMLEKEVSRGMIG